MKFILSILHRAGEAGTHARQVGDFDRLEDAIAAAKREVDALLAGIHTPEMTSEQLVEHYRAAAQTPYIVRDDEETMNARSFNHFQYAKTRSDELCGSAK
jgi:hypothetical protein